MDVAHAVVINLRRRPDRLAAFTQRWIEARVPVALTFWRATDGRHGVPARVPWNRLPPGAWGCWRSHQDVLRRHPGPLLVMEDDAVLRPTFGADLAALDPPEDWALIYLGGQHLAPPSPFRPGLVVPQRIIRSHCYLARDPQLLADELGETYVDYALNQVRVPRYAVDPLWVTQDPRAGSDIPIHWHT